MPVLFGSTQITNVNFNGLSTYNVAAQKGNSSTYVLSYNTSNNITTMAFGTSSTPSFASNLTLTTSAQTISSATSIISIGASTGISGITVLINGNSYTMSAGSRVSMILNQATTITIGGAAPAACMVRGTKINMADGTLKNIEDITFDDEVLAWDFDNGVQTTAKPSSIQCVRASKNYNLLTLEDGITLKTVYNHSWFNITKNKFTRTMEATDIGDEIMTIYGPKKLLSKEVIEEDCEYFNFITEKHINWYAEGILVGNHFCNLYEFKDMKYVKVERPLNKYKDFAGYNIDKKTFNNFRVAEYDIKDIDYERQFLCDWRCFEQGVYQGVI